MPIWQCSGRLPCKLAALHCAVCKQSQHACSLHCLLLYSWQPTCQSRSCPPLLCSGGAAGKTPFETACGWLHLDAARLLLEEAPLQPAAEILAALNKKGSWVLPLYASVVARLPLTPEQWELVPAPCPGLGAALPTILQRSEAEAALLAARLPAADRERMHTFALCLARAERERRLPPLPVPLVTRLLALSVA